MIRPDHSFRTVLNYLIKQHGSDLKLRTRNLIPIFLGVVLLSISTTSVFADPWYGSSAVAVGDQYSVTTISGVAQAWIDGRLVIDSASLELQVQVTFVGPYNVVFRVLAGTFQIGGKSYAINVGLWRGDYNIRTHSSVYQGPATALNGGEGYFTLYGEDLGVSNGGVLTHIYCDFTGEYGALWHVSLTAVRYQTN